MNEESTLRSTEFLLLFTTGKLCLTSKCLETLGNKKMQMELVFFRFSNLEVVFVYVFFLFFFYLTASGGFQILRLA